MTIKQTTYGLIGYPLGHSLSPCMHNTAFRALDVPAVYELFPLQENELGPFVESLKSPDCHIFGLNVTVPYKEKVIPFLDALSPFAEKAGAVNTIEVDQDRRLIGHNTDGPGFWAHLAELNFHAQGKRVAILGAGGAARAIISMLCLMDGPPIGIRLYDIDTVKAESLISDLSVRIDTGIVEVVSCMEDLNIELADMLINATPIGLKGSDPCLVEHAVLHADMLVYDLIYNPKETALLKAAASKGARTANGLGMLFYQGVLAFEHWAGFELSSAIREQMRMSLTLGEVI